MDKMEDVKPKKERKPKSKNCSIFFTNDDTLYDAKNVSGRPTLIIDFDPLSKKDMFGIAVKDKETAEYLRDMFQSMIPFFEKKSNEEALAKIEAGK